MNLKSCYTHNRPVGRQLQGYSKSIILDGKALFLKKNIPLLRCR